MEMRLEQLIDYLKKQNPEKRLVMGLGKPDSYRGYYDQLAFPLQPNVTVGEMIASAELAIGTTYQGYKGGDFTMDKDTYVHVAGYGSTGSELSYGLIDEMLKYEVNNG